MLIKRWGGGAIADCMSLVVCSPPLLYLLKLFVNYDALLFQITGLDGVIIQTSNLTLGVTPLDVRCGPANSEALLYVNSFTLTRNGTSVAKVTYNRATQSSTLIVLDVTDNRAR